MTAAWITGWLAVAAMAVAVGVPIYQRVKHGKRAAPGSEPIRLHVVIGLTVSACAFGHTLLILPELGSPAATAGGMLALLPGGVAFVFMLAHAGLGLQLRDPKLKKRPDVRRSHTITATLIAIFVAIHAVALERAAR
ncbi:MAG: hypothetical protein U0270_13145 [Labilithrix sp.]